MTLVKGLAVLGSVSAALAALLGLASMATGVTGCTAPVDGPRGLAKTGPGNESVGTSVSAESAAYGNVNCQGSAVTVIRAYPLTQPNGTVAYQGSISALEALVCETSSPSYDVNVCNFTESYYDDIYGAAGYYYITNEFPGYERNPNGAYWVSIPIIDSQPDVPTPVGFYGSYPGLETVRFPSYAILNGLNLNSYAAMNPATWPELGGFAEGHWVGLNDKTGLEYPFLLSTSNYSELVSVMNLASSSAKTVAAQDTVCLLIEDQNGNVLDFSAHISQWDPKPSCPDCGN
jgi:hypothetical protein